MKVRKAVIPAAGLGTRFLPATKSIPKEMIPIIDKPMIQYIVEECVNAGIEDIILVTARGKDAIIDHFDYAFELETSLKEKNKHDLLAISEAVSKMANIITVRQKQPMGLGHAVLTAKKIIGSEPFAVLLGDDLIVAQTPCIKQLMNVYDRHQTSVIGVMEVAKPEVSKYGIIGGKLIEKNLFNVSEMVEKPKVELAPSQLACPGRYILDAKIFEFLANAKPGASGEIQLTDSLHELARINQLLAYQFEGTRYDTGDKLGFIEATIAFALNRPDLKDGVMKILKNYSKL